MIKIAVKQTKSYVLDHFDPLVDQVFLALGSMLPGQDTLIRNAKQVWVEPYPAKLKTWITERIDDQAMDEIAAVVLAETKAQLQSPETRDRIKQVLVHEIHRIERNTATLVDQERLAEVIQNHQCAHRIECQDILREKIEAVDLTIQARGITILSLCAVIFMILLSGRCRDHPLVLTTLIATCSLLWAGGILTPMLQVEAKIAQLDVVIGGETIQFSDQLLFYQSKSVIDFVILLMETGQIQLVVVGFLVGLFSVVFPLLKLVSSYLYLRR